MTKTRVEFNQSYFDNFMRTGPVEALVEARAEAVLATAKATAPVDTGAYRDSIAVHKRAGQYRDAYVVEGSDPKTMIIEARTGNLARAVRRTKE